MTAPNEFRCRISNAAAQLNSAFTQWETASVASREASCRLLSAAIDEIETAQKLAQEHLIGGTADARQGLNEIRSLAVRMMRIVDASAALCRGIAAHSGILEAAESAPTPVSIQG